jgi:regulatory protein
MQIYKISDTNKEPVAKNLVNSENNHEDTEKMEQKITKIAPAVKTAGRYNIFVNDKFSFSLDEVQLVKLGLKKGQEVSTEDLAKFKSESDFGKNYIRAVDFISRRPRSEREIRDYAWRKQWSKENLENVIKRLYERGYLNDEKFAESFVRSRANLRNFSTRKMKVELIKKGINSAIIEKVLSENNDFDENESLKKLIQKKRGHYDDERKLVAYLARQGFSYDKIKTALESE